MTFKYFLVAVLIGFIFYLLLLRRLDVLRKAVISVVVLTMLASASFDPRTIWDRGGPA